MEARRDAHKVRGWNKFIDPAKSFQNGKITSVEGRVENPSGSSLIMMRMWTIHTSVCMSVFMYVYMCTQRQGKEGSAQRLPFRWRGVLEARTTAILGE